MECLGTPARLETSFINVRAFVWQLKTMQIWALKNRFGMPLVNYGDIPGLDLRGEGE